MTFKNSLVQGKGVGGGGLLREKDWVCFPIRDDWWGLILVQGRNSPINLPTHPLALSAFSSSSIWLDFIFAIKSDTAFAFFLNALPMAALSMTASVTSTDTLDRN